LESVVKVKTYDPIQRSEGLVPVIEERWKVQYYDPDHYKHIAMKQIHIPGEYERVGSAICVVSDVDGSEQIPLTKHRVVRKKVARRK
jgi:hypothetical protein